MSAKKKILSYSAFATAFLGIKTDVQSQVVIVDYDPDLIINISTDYSDEAQINIDADFDGLNDLIFNLSYETICGYCDQRHNAWVNPVGDGSAHFLPVSGTLACSTSGFSLNLYAFEEIGDYIGEDLIFTNDNITFFRQDGGAGYCNLIYGITNFETENIGFVLEKPDGNHYGWIRLSCYDATTLIIHGLGYNTTPNESIMVGDTNLVSMLVLSEVNDIDNQIDGRDLGFEFLRMNPEADAISYRAICVKSDLVPLFDIEDAKSLPETAYKEILPIGDIFYSDNFDENSLTSDGDYITNNVDYTVFILGVYFNGIDTTYFLTNDENNITLTSEMDMPNITLNDINDFENAHDFRLTIPASSTSEAISEYRVYLTDHTVAGGIDTWLSFPSEDYVTVVPADYTYFYTFSEEFRDIDGDLISCETNYTACLVAINNGLAEDNGYSLSSSKSINCTTKPVVNINLVDAGETMTVTDFKVTFEMPLNTSSINELWLVLVPETEAAAFTIDNVNDLMPFNIHEFNPPIGADTSFYLDAYLNDVNNDAILPGTNYVVFILSTASPSGTTDVLSSPSNPAMLLAGVNSIENYFEDVTAQFSDDYLNILVPNQFMGKLICTVYSIDGKKILESPLSQGSNNILLSSPKGCYLITLQDEQYSYIIQLIK